MSEHKGECCREEADLYFVFGDSGEETTVPNDASFPVAKSSSSDGELHPEARSTARERILNDSIGGHGRHGAGKVWVCGKGCEGRKDRWPGRTTRTCHATAAARYRFIVLSHTGVGAFRYS